MVILNSFWNQLYDKLVVRYFSWTLSTLGLSLINLVLSQSVAAQVTSDGSLSTTVSSNDNRNFTITNGGRLGNNLFHSFNEFSVPTNGSAVFNNPTTVQNIFSRVTGNTPSRIDGVIQANGKANLFLLNPNGIQFESNASLKLGGSFFASTAETLIFNDKVEFSTDSRSAPILTVSAPIGLGFGANPRPIIVKGPGTNGSFLEGLTIPEETLGLTIPTKQTLALIGGDIQIEGGILRANQGRIELGSVAQSGDVDIMSASDGFTLNYSSINDFGDLKLTEAALLDVSGEGSGNLHLQARTLSVVESSAILSNVQGADSGGEIRIRAAESVDILSKPNKPFLAPRSFISNEGLEGSTGNVGDFTIETQRLQISNGSFISNIMSGAGRAGDIRIKANDIRFAGESNSLTGLFSNVSPTGTGQGVTTTIDADTLSMTSSSTINSATFGDGNAGDTILNVDTLHIADTSQIFNGTGGRGNGGDIDIDANEIIITSLEKDDPFLAGIYSSSVSFSSLGNIGPTTSQNRNAGNINIKASRLLQLNGLARISSLTRTTGKAGDINIQAGELVVSGTAEGMARISDDPELTSRITSLSESTSTSGKLDITAAKILVTDQGLISSSNVGGGDANNLTIRADQVLLTDGGSLQAEVSGGDQGNIFLTANSFLALQNSAFISTNATNESSGGNITIETPLLLGFNNSDIIANAFQGNGGNINITTDFIFGLEITDNDDPRNNNISEITASSQLGIDGLLSIQTPGIDPSQTIVVLPQTFIDNSEKISSHCKTGDGRFIVTGRNGLPAQPKDLTTHDQPWADLRDLSSIRRSSPAQAEAILHSPQQLAEATALQVNDMGQVILVSAVTSDPSITGKTTCLSTNPTL